jgi:uncharacterized protein YbbC (DUF1343 family)
MKVRTGLQRLADGEVDLVRGKKIGLLANPTAVDRNYRHAIDVLQGIDGVELVALFGPEHGIRGDAQDMISVGDAKDSQTGLPVHSLYGADEASLAPTPEMLAGIDTLVFDIQDIGTRYYTYAWTLVYAMRVCGELGIEIVVLDRPNPIGGIAVEGGAVESGFESFVGLCSIPNRHGLTVGELAGWAQDTQNISSTVHVVRAEGWQRDMMYADTGVPWVMPSPNMPTTDTALVYPGMCLVEGTELSEARGTTRPFELVGAPYIDGAALAESLAKEDLPGVSFRPVVFTPQFQKHARVACGGVQLHVTDSRSFRPYLTGVAFLRAAKMLYPDDFAWRTRAYEFVDTIPAVDLLAGSAALREGIDRGDSLDQLASTWSAAEKQFASERDRWFLYQ